MLAHAASSSPAAATAANRETRAHPSTFRGHMRDTVALPARQWRDPPSRNRFADTIMRQIG
jgi:hypothetical protein